MAINLPRTIVANSPFKDRNEEQFTPSAAQTVFAIAATPNDPSNVDFRLNTVSYVYSVDYTVSGTTVTWTNGIVLATTDRVDIVYYV